MSQQVDDKIAIGSAGMNSPAAGGPATQPIFEAEPAAWPSAYSDPSNNLGRLVGGRYQIVDLLARGGMSQLYCARDLSADDHVVAVKEFNARGAAQAENWALVAAFMREANILSSLEHPHIVQAARFIEDSGNYYMVMEWLGGQNLNRKLEQSPDGLPETQVREWARQLSSALQYLHTRRPPVIFCDLKPGNIFLLENGQVKLVDFGIAHYYFRDAVNEMIRFGTPGFAAPEQYRAGQISPATDIYSLGRTLHCLLTGFDPQGESEAATAFDFPSARSLRPEISELTSAALQSAMNLDPARRYQSAEEFSRALALEPAVEK